MNLEFANALVENQPIPAEASKVVVPGLSIADLQIDEMVSLVVLCSISLLLLIASILFWGLCTLMRLTSVSSLQSSQPCRC